MITLQSLNDRINIRGMIDGFMDIMIERFEKSMQKKRVGNSKTAKGLLIRSFRKALFYTGNDVPKASLTFLAYGRMVDAGFGRGSNANDRAYLRQARRHTGETPRRRKAWYSKTKASQLHRFRELMVKQYGEALVTEAEHQLTQQITLNNIL